MAKRQDLTGQTFGKLTAIKYIKPYQGNSVWLWQCACGNTKEIRANAVKLQKTRSCGCIGHNWSGLSDDDRGLNRIYSNYKYSAKKRKLIFQLTEENVLKLIKQECFYCGSKFGNHLRRKIGNRDFDIFYNGIDRKDPSIGYISNNVVTCCAICNIMKNTLTTSQFISQIKKISVKIPT